MDELQLSVESLHPAIAAQVASFIHEHLGTCEHPGCMHPVIKHEQYACRNCSDANIKHHFCLASHMAFIDLVARYSEEFQQDEWLPPSGYYCITCVIELDLLFVDYQVERMKL